MRAADPHARAVIAALLVIATMCTDVLAQAIEDLTSFPRASLTIATRGGAEPRFDVWLADTPSRQAQGLMFVASLDAGKGMLFVADEPRTMSMWMKNTLIPLDMVFIDVEGRIARIAANTRPHSLATVSSGEPVKAVLELAGGECARLGIRPGDRVSLDGGLVFGRTIRE